MKTRTAQRCSDGRRFITDFLQNKLNVPVACVENLVKQHACVKHADPRVKLELAYSTFLFCKDLHTWHARLSGATGTDGLRDI